MKKYLSLIICSLSLFSAFAQEESWCGTDAYNESIFEANPELKVQMHEHLLRIKSGEIGSDREEGCIIPVVVHILHDNGSGNISIEQVQSGIDMLNEDFNRENTDADETRDTDTAPFLDVATDMGVNFQLAKIDPDGNCTNGIERRFVGAASYNCDNTSKHYSSNGLNAWNRNFYFNIWIVNSISSGSGGITLGYAEFPYSGGSSNYGVIIRNDAYGSIGTASFDRTLTHEVGHCLGLLHTFQGGCHSGDCDANGDYCCDTPPVDEAHWSCSSSINSCGEPSGDHFGFNALDQFENFMSYSPCQNMFSADQKEIVLGNFDGIGFLSNLISESHYSATGVGFPDVLCKAQFHTEKTVTCSGTTVQYSDNSFDIVTGRSWTFEGGTPATSTVENPIITYDTPGNYSVSLEVTDGSSTVSTTVDNNILVLPETGATLPYSQNFEALAEIPDNLHFLVSNDDLDDTWEIFESTEYSGNCAYISNRGNISRTKDALMSAPIDLSTVDAEDDMIFSFKYAYKKRHTFDDEWIRIFISRDCGETWILRKNIHGDALSEEVQSSKYTPTEESDWTEVVIENITSSYYVSNFRYKIEFENDNGNNIYIDNINLYPVSMVGLVENQSENIGISIYPNPATDILNINITSSQNTDVSIVLHNAIGEEIQTVYTGAVQTGKQSFTQDISTLPTGIYFIRSINTAGNAETIRFVKK